MRWYLVSSVGTWALVGSSEAAHAMREAINSVMAWTREVEGLVVWREDEKMCDWVYLRCEGRS